MLGSTGFRAGRYPPGTIAIVSRGEVGAGLWRHAMAGQFPAFVLPVTPVGGTDIAQGRNHAVYEMEGDWLLFVDSDVEPELDVVLRLLDTGRPLIGAPVPVRSFPFEANVFKSLRPPVRYRASELPETGILEVAAVGTGCLLIRHEVLEAVQRLGVGPWFQVGHYAPDQGAEDVYFCDLATQAGYRPAILCDLRPMHEFQGQVYLGRDGQVWVKWPGVEDLRSPVLIKEARHGEKEEARQSEAEAETVREETVESGPARAEVVSRGTLASM